MRVRHIVESAPKLPKTNKVYGAMESGVIIHSDSVTFKWRIFARKPRAKKGKGK